MYFNDCRNLNDLKAAYKRLAMENHPDKGGDVREMQEINAEYDRMFSRLKDAQNQAAEAGEDGAQATTEAPEDFKAVVSALLALAGIEIELCGSWLWIAGGTFAHKDALKAAGCMWSASKGKWYWRHAEDGARWSRGRKTMGQIRSKYGSLRVTAEREALPAE